MDQLERKSFPFGFGHSNWMKEEGGGKSGVINTVDGMLMVRATFSNNYRFEKEGKIVEKDFDTDKTKKCDRESMGM